MSKERWCTKLDVQEDLAALGLDQTELDDEHIVLGNRPPPVPRESIDDEMLLAYGADLSDTPIDYHTKPDLSGITRLLRMVEESEQDKEQDLPSDVIEISKLNPNVEDFVPKRKKTNESDTPLKLLTPEYFEQSIKEDTPCKSIPEDELFENKSSDTSLTFSSPASVNSSMQKSIEKVNTWFNSEPKQSKLKPPVLSLEQSGFRRKNKAEATSPNPEAANKPSTSGTVRQYTPSKYANELFEKYQDRDKKKQAVKQNIWTTLEAQLKAKDEEIRRKKMEQENARGGDN